MRTKEVLKRSGREERARVKMEVKVRRKSLGGRDEDVLYATISEKRERQVAGCRSSTLLARIGSHGEG